jgi:hypothetical protein
MNGTPSWAPTSWMVQMLGWLSCDACWALEPRVRVGVAAGCDLHRHVPTKLGVAGDIHVAHATGAEEPPDLVAADDLARERLAGGSAMCTPVAAWHRRWFHKARRLHVSGKEPLHFGTNRGIAAAGLGQKRRPLRRLALERGVKDLLNLQPPFQGALL